MLDFMDYIQQSFYHSAKWNLDNSYSGLNATAQAILDFQTPKGIRLNISSLATPHFSSSYTIALAGPVTGQLSYLYSSLPLAVASKSSAIPLSSLLRGYRHLPPLTAPEDARFWETWQRGTRVDERDTLLYGRIFLPASRLEGLLLRRLTPSCMLQMRGVSDNSLPNGGSLLAVLHSDQGKYSSECLFSTDSAMLGLRALYNVGHDPRAAQHVATAHAPPPSLFSMGLELYYGLLNKSGGISTGLRFTTLPAYTSFPYTMTLTLNPLMGNLSSTYAVKAGRHLALSSRFDFNFYSYESSVLVGCELWRLRRKTLVERVEDRVAAADMPLSATAFEDTMNPGMETMAGLVADNGSSAATQSGSLLRSLAHGFPSVPNDEDVVGVLKARVDQDWRIGLLWEGRFKELLFSVGASLDLKRRERVFAGLGVEFQYSN